MKKYLTIIVVAAFSMLFVAKSYSQNSSNAAASDQPKKTVEQRTTSMVDEMTKAAALTPDEVSKITPFVTEFQKQKDVDQETNKGNKEKLATARKVRTDKLSAQVKDIVTPDQYAKLQDYWKNKNNRVPGNQPATKE
jgi:long-subunit acyl-CoA synthetase (AMP-forming)